MKNTHYLILILAIGLAGCKKNEATDKPSSNLQKSNIATCYVSDTRELTDSQVDSIANAHNSQLSNAMANMNWSATSLKTEAQQAFQNLWNSGMPVTYETYCSYFPDNPETGLDSTLLDSSLIDPSAFYTTYYDVLSYVSDEQHSFTDIANYINTKKSDVILNQTGSDIDRTLIFLQTTKRSAYFWLPTSRGGSGIGYGYLETWCVNNDVDPNIVLAAPTLGGVMTADAIGATKAWLVIGLCLCPTPVTLGAIAAIVGGAAAWDSFMYVALALMFD